MRAARAAVSRRRLQTLIVGMVVLLSAATAVLALGLLVVSHAPFDSAFAPLAEPQAAVTIAADRADRRRRGHLDGIGCHRRAPDPSRRSPPA